MSNKKVKQLVETKKYIRKVDKTADSIVNNKPRMVKKVLPKPYRKGSLDNVLIIGDLHSPFTREGYLEFCRDKQEEYKCGKVVLIGDILDNHFSSFHETIPDGKSAGDELMSAIEQIQDWYKVFPSASVTLGNHDMLIHRKAIANGISEKWIKAFGEVLNTPNWVFDMEFIIHNVLYTHGTNSTGARAALNRAIQRRMSCVQGHIHTEAGVSYSVSEKDILFGLQVACGINDKEYAFAYAKNFIKKSIIGCGAVLNKGTLPIFLPMEL